MAAEGGAGGEGGPRSGGVGGRGLTGAVGAGDRHGAGDPQQGQGQRVIGHAHRDGAASLAEVPAQVGGGGEDQGQRAGPESLDQGAGGGRDVGHDAGELVGAGDQHRRGHLAAASLGGQEPGDGSGIRGQGADAVHGVRGHDQQATALHVRRSALQRLKGLRRYRAPLRPHHPGVVI